MRQSGRFRPSESIGEDTAPKRDIRAVAAGEVLVTTMPGARMAPVTPKETDLGQAPARVPAEPSHGNQVVSSSGEITVIFDTPPALVRRGEAPRPAAVERHRRSIGAHRTAGLWLLGLAEAVFVVGGLGVLLSCWFVRGSAAATDRAYLGIGLVFAGALVAVPATALIGERAHHGRGSHAKGRHRSRR